MNNKCHYSSLTAHQLKLSDAQHCLTGDKGYCMARATHSVHTGTWYYELTITEQPENSATRIGWSQLMGKSLSDSTCAPDIRRTLNMKLKFLGF